MYESLTVDQVEALRKHLDLTVEEFSKRLGYSPRAYYNAKDRGQLSKWMRKEIAQRFGRALSEIRQ